MHEHEQFISNMFLLQLLSALVASAASISRTDWPSLMQRLRREVVDLHSGEFCVDVSTYGAVVFEPTSREKCDTTFQKQCEDKNEQVGCISGRSQTTLIRFWLF